MSISLILAQFNSILIKQSPIRPNEGFVGKIEFKLPWLIELQKFHLEQIQFAKTKK